MIDTTVSIVIVIILISQLVALTIGYKIKKPIVSMAYANASISLGILVFCGIDMLSLKQHQWQIIDVLIIGLEVSILLFALCAIIGFHQKKLVKIINKIGFWFHVLAAIGMFVFMSTFKLDRLF